MRRDDWLVGYGRVEGVERALIGIAKRCRRPNPLASGTAVLLAHHDALQADFERFFPQLQDFASGLTLADGPDPQDRAVPENPPHPRVCPKACGNARL